MFQYSLNCLHWPLSPLLKFYKPTAVICHTRSETPSVGMTQIDGTRPSVSPVCQMAGGLHSRDIHQCLAVRCSLSSVLTLGLVQQTSLFCSSMGATRSWSNDATKWGAIAWEQLEIWPIWHHFSMQLCNSVPLACTVDSVHGLEQVWGIIQKSQSLYFQHLHKHHSAASSASVASPIIT